jgi:hypothetical protein
MGSSNFQQVELDLLLEVLLLPVLNLRVATIHESFETQAVVQASIICLTA